MSCSTVCLFALERDVVMHTSITVCRVNLPGRTPGEYHLGGITQPEEKKKKDGGKEVSSEQEMIDRFKEENSPENNRVSQIYGKFRAGQELTAEELDYLSRHSPEVYKQIREIMMERKALEARMKQAETKQEVHAVITNENVVIKKTMGTGGQAKREAMKTMARTNQMTNAAQKFLASAEYREKDDEKTQAEERLAALEEYEEQLSKQQEQLFKQAERLRRIAAELAAKNEISAGTKNEADGKKAEKTLKQPKEAEKPEKLEQDNEKAKRHRRRRRAQQKQQSNAAGNEASLVTLDDLYRRFKAADESNRGNGVDIKL